MIGRFIVGLAALALAGCASLPPAFPTAPSLRIAVIGDRTGGNRPEVFERAMADVQALQPDLVLSVGDLIEGYVEDEQEVERQWNEVAPMLQPFGPRFHAVPGNHDYSNAAMARIWRERMGPPYWSLLQDGVLILGLSTEDPPVVLPEAAREGQVRLQAAMERDPVATQAMILEAASKRAVVPLPGEAAISAEQVAYFRDVLAANPSPRWTIMLMHKPAWKSDSAGFAQLEQLLADRPYTVIAGHEHYYSHEQRQGRDYITMGTTGGIWLRDGPGRVDHILWMTLGEGAPDWANIAIDGIFGPQER